MSSVSLNVLKRVYLLVSTILLFDTWLLISRTAIVRDARRRRFLLLLLFLLPLLLLGGKSKKSLNPLSHFLTNLINTSHYHRHFLSTVNHGIPFALANIFPWEVFRGIQFHPKLRLSQISIKPESRTEIRSRSSEQLLDRCRKCRTTRYKLFTQIIHQYYTKLFVFRIFLWNVSLDIVLFKITIHKKLSSIIICN